MSSSLTRLGWAQFDVHAFMVHKWKCKENGMVWSFGTKLGTGLEGFLCRNTSS